jgi:hypothetical protein
MREIHHRLEALKLRARTIRDMQFTQANSTDILISALEYEAEEMTTYKTPQWHHTILWTGFAFMIGMLLGAGLVAG